MAIWPTHLPKGGPMRSVLLVEDNALVSSTISEAFSLSGVALTHAADGPAALVALESSRHDLALIDVGLPGLSGIDVAKRAVELEVPAVLMTGYGDVLAKADGLLFPVLSKPFRVRELVLRLEEVCAEAARLNRIMREQMMRGAELIAEARDPHRPFSETWLRICDRLML